MEEKPIVASFQTTPRQLDMLRVIAAREDRSLSYVIRRAIEEMLAREEVSS